MRKEFNKLVRDKIPGIIRDEGREAVVSHLTGQPLLDALYTKLAEEHEEFKADHSLEELADMLEVIFAIAQQRGASREDIMKLAKAKCEKNGGFEQGLFLHAVEDSK